MEGFCQRFSGYVGGIVLIQVAHQAGGERRIGLFLGIQQAKQSEEFALQFQMAARSPVQKAFQLLKERNLTLSTAESCTGGRVAERITALPGVSSVYRGGVVSYWTSVKAAVLGVPQETLDQYGAVSEETARAMAEGARQITGADIAVSVTGVAGPDRDERDNPVGLVYIGLATPEGTFCRRTDSGRRRRDRIQELAANHALDVVRRYLTGLPIG